jgi:antitoxin SocA-like protein
MNFVFDIRKAIAASGYICNLAGGSFDMLKLIKAIYLAERQALLEWHRPITGDTFYSLENGPIVSRIYDLIRGRVMGPEMEAWREVFNPRQADTVSLKKLAITGPLSKREKDALASAYEKLKDLSIGEVIDFVHSLPEWKDPGKSSALIDPKTIFYHENLGEDAVERIEEDLAFHQAAKTAFQAC